MRSSIRKIPHPLIARATTSASIPAALSTSGGVRGRGGPTPFIFTVDSSAQTESDTPKDESPSSLGHGHGRGRGKPLHSPPILPSFPSFVNNDAGPAAIGRGRGCGFIPTKTIPPQESKWPPQNSDAKKPYLFVEDDAHRDSTDSESPVRHEKFLPSEIINVLSGAGRGKPTKPEAAHVLKPKTENRHVRPQQPTKPKSSAEDQLTPYEKVKKAVGILSKGDGESMSVSDDIRGDRGRLCPRGGRGRGRERLEDKYEDSDNDEPEGLYLGDPADGEKLAEKLGPEVMYHIAKRFQEMSSWVLPSPADDGYIDLLHNNSPIEWKREYLMDIDEKPLIPLQKMKRSLWYMKEFEVKKSGRK